MRIGDLAKLTELNPKTIRFYEEEGILPTPPRLNSGYRSYGPDDVARLKFIIKAKSLSLSLQEIKRILRLYDRSEPTCVHVRSLLDEKLLQIESRLDGLTQFRDEVLKLKETVGDIEDCRPVGGDICAIIENLNDTLWGETNSRENWRLPLERISR